MWLSDWAHRPFTIVERERALGKWWSQREAEDDRVPDLFTWEAKHRQAQKKPAEGELLEESMGEVDGAQQVPGDRLGPQGEKLVNRVKSQEGQLKKKQKRVSWNWNWLPPLITKHPEREAVAKAYPSYFIPSSLTANSNLEPSNNGSSRKYSCSLIKLIAEWFNTNPAQ